MRLVEARGWENAEQVRHFVRGRHVVGLGEGPRPDGWTSGADAPAFTRMARTFADAFGVVEVRDEPDTVGCVAGVRLGARYRAAPGTPVLSGAAPVAR